MVAECVDRLERMVCVVVERIEELVENHYACVKLAPDTRDTIESRLREDLNAHYEENRAQSRRFTTRRTNLLNQRAKLLEAHYAGAVPLDLLRDEQLRISRELATVEQQINASDDHHRLVRDNLRRALDLARDCQAAYSSAPPLVRRLLNHVFFNKLYILDADTLHSELASPFDVLMADANDTAAAVTSEETTPNDSDPEADGPRVAGVKEPILVAGAGFEPATSGL